MKRFYVKTAGLVFVIAALASCQAQLNDVPVPEEGAVTETLVLSFEDTSSDTKVGIATGTGKFSWTAGDQIAVWYQNGSTGAWSTGPVSATSRITISGTGDRAKLAVYPASARSNFNMAQVDNSTYADITKITYPTEIDLTGKDAGYSPMPMIALNDPSRSGLKFFHVGGLIRFKLYGIPKGTMYVKIANTTTDQPLAGDFPIGIPSGNEISAAGLVYTRSQWAYLYGDASWNTVFGASHRKEVVVKVTNTAYTAETDGVTINLPVPLGVYDKLTITALNASKQPISTVGSVSYVAAQPDVLWDCERATGRHLTAQALREQHPMVLPTYVHGKFSVANGKQVWFATGNLVVTYHSASSMDWAFEAKQWDYTASFLSGSNYQTNNQRISHFGWGTGTNPTNISTNNADYSSFVDWGKHFNAVGEGSHSRSDGTWYTLSSAEWQYLITGRPDASMLVGKGMIHDAATGQYINGLFLLKDDWDRPVSCSFRPGATADYSTNMYTTGDRAEDFDGSWQEMEAAGAVFLPAAGYRYGSNFYYAGYIGIYWSSTPYDSERADCLGFGSSGVGPQDSNGRYSGFSVRLVHD